MGLRDNHPFSKQKHCTAFHYFFTYFIPLKFYISSAVAPSIAIHGISEGALQVCVLAKGGCSSL